MKNENDFLELALITRNKLLGFGIKENSLVDFDRHVKLLHNFLIIEKFDFNLKNGMHWLDDYSKGKKEASKLRARRTILLLWDCSCGNLTEHKAYINNKAPYPKSENYISLLDKYRETITKDDYSDYTIKNLVRYARYLLLYLERLSITDIADLTRPVVTEYFASSHFSNRKPLGVKTESSAVRIFLRFLYDEQISDCPYLYFAVPQNFVAQESIITTITQDAEDQLLSDYPNLPTNKRSKAMFLLALRLGLRTNEVFNLKYENINWEHSQLKIKLSKNGKHVTRKIDNETLNALIDYILTERRDAETPYIFTTSVGPKKRLTIRSLQTSKNRVSGLDIKKHIPSQGLHILRRTFATRLLNSGVSLSVISGALGHVNKSQVDHYLSVDEKKMRSCALSLTSIEFGRGEF